MAGRIPENVVTEIRERVNIVDVISPYVQLKKQGRNLFGNCPFHEERTPSFSVNEEKQIFHCFSCGRGGNAFSFLMELENLSFPQAVAKVAPLADVTLDTSYLSDGKTETVDPQIKALRELYADATKLYHHLLINTASGEDALTYLQNRGLDDQTIDAFMLGYAPKNDVLLEYFQGKGIDYQLLRASELFVEWDDGSLHDRFNDRILFTIRDQSGHPIAFSGRRLTQDDDQPKYINSPESPLFNKSRELFNLDLAQNDIKQSKHVIMFEGFMDVIAAFQAGVRNGVASMGTSLTVEQVQRLDRMANQITIAYDADAAGQKATKRALDLLSQKGSMQVSVAHIPDNQDPDEYLRSHDAAAFMDLMTHHTEDPVSFNMRYLRHERNLTNQNDVFAYISDVLNLLARIDSKVVQDTYMNKLSQEFNISIEALQEQMRPFLLRKRVDEGAFIEPPEEDEDFGNPEANWQPLVEHKKETPTQKAEQMLLAWMLRDPDVWLMVTQDTRFSFADVSYETLYQLTTAFRAQGHATEAIDIQVLMDFVQKPDLNQILATFSAIPDDLFQDKSHVTAYMQVIMTNEPLAQRITNIKQQLADAHARHDQALEAQLSVELITALREQQLAKKM
ncbi:DNA primase [Weissella tructae]|nr:MULTISPECIES: DNA primase [Weissella]AIG65428.1 DNA primase [Weissella tructae]AIM64077.1 DNA primase [Weissella ceti]ELA07112.1 DNA primase [Weissella ceti NC36]QVV91804.1 DNA primase [Weissella tructae]